MRPVVAGDAAALLPPVRALPPQDSQAALAANGRDAADLQAVGIDVKTWSSRESMSTRWRARWPRLDSAGMRERWRRADLPGACGAARLPGVRQDPGRVGRGRQPSSPTTAGLPLLTATQNRHYKLAAYLLDKGRQPEHREQRRLDVRCTWPPTTATSKAATIRCASRTWIIWTSSSC